MENLYNNISIYNDTDDLLLGFIPTSIQNAIQEYNDNTKDTNK